MKPKSFSKMSQVKPPQSFTRSTKKDNGKPVRISTEHYEKLRQEAFQQNISMKSLLDDIIDAYYLCR